MPASKKASMPELASDEIKLAPTEAVRAAMDLHDSSVKTISLRGRDYFPFTNKAGCRTFSIGPYQFMTQNPNKKDSKTAELAKKGHKLTWIIKFKQWGLVQDGQIMRTSSLIDPKLAEWVSLDSTVQLKLEGSGRTKRVKPADPNSDKLFTNKSETEILRTYSNPFEATLETNSNASSSVPMDEDEQFEAKSITIPAAVSQFIIPWSQLKLAGKIGSGAFGDVKKAKWRDTPVAVKLLHASDATDAFFQEASLLCSLRHPNVVSCLGVCVEDPNMAIVMELMSGNLSSLLAAGPMPLKTLLPIAIGIARGLAFLHQRSPKIIHRDIKPENILIDAGGAPKLGDFGVSKESLMTMTQTKIGTPSYAAPELLNSEAYGTAVDIYSMAMVLYVMATAVAPFATLGNGVKPFSPLQVMMKVAIHRERPIIPATVHPKLAAIIRDCWNHFPKQRPTASVLLERLIELEEELIMNGSIATPVAPQPSIEATIPLTATIPLNSTSGKASIGVKTTVKGGSNDATVPLVAKAAPTATLPLLVENSTTVVSDNSSGRVTRSRTRQIKTNQTAALAGLSLNSSLVSSPASSQQSQLSGLEVSSAAEDRRSRKSAAPNTKKRARTPATASKSQRKAKSSTIMDDEDEEADETLDFDDEETANTETTESLKQMVHQAELEEANFRTQQRWRSQAHI
jgi:serine/threonine protein kinase